MKFKVGFVFSLILFTSGCDNTRPGTTQNNFSSSSLEAPTSTLAETARSAALNAIRNQTVTCEDENCHEAVGSLSILMPGENPESYSPARCTAFMVTPQIIATNRHCIPEDIATQLSAGNGDCRGRMVMHFPELRSKPAANIECSRVIYASVSNPPEINNRRGRPAGDYAFIELAQPITDRTPLQFDLDSIVEDSRAQSPHPTYRMPYFNAMSETSGVMRNKSCEASVGIAVNSFIYGARSSATSIVRNLRDCGMPHGSSGSPILNSSGAVVGIHFGAIAQTITGFIGQESDRANSLLDRTLQILTLANVQIPRISAMQDITFFVAARCLRFVPPSGLRNVNISCIQRDEDDEATEAQAQAILDEEERTTASSTPLTPAPANNSAVNARNTILKKIFEAELSKQGSSGAGLLNWTRSHNQVFHWGFRGLVLPGQPILIYPVPICFKPVESWQSEFRNHFLFIPTGQREHHAISLDGFPVYQMELSLDRSWIFNIGVNDYYAAHPSIDQHTRSSTILAFYPRRAISAGGAGAVGINTLLSAITPSQRAVEHRVLSILAGAESTDSRMDQVLENYDLVSRLGNMRAYAQENGIEDQNSQEGLAIRYQYARPLFGEELGQCTPAQLAETYDFKVSTFDGRWE